MKLVYQYMAIVFTFPPTSNHLHPLQVDNSRLVVNEDDNVKSGLKGVTELSLDVNFWSRRKDLEDTHLFNDRPHSTEGTVCPLRHHIFLVHSQYTESLSRRCAILFDDLPTMSQLRFNVSKLSAVHKSVKRMRPSSWLNDKLSVSIGLRGRIISTRKPSLGFNLARR